MNDRTQPKPVAGARTTTADYVVHMRFYEELNDLLPPGQRKRTFPVACAEKRSVKDLIESQGVPHTEVDLILIDGEPVGLDALLSRDARVSVYPAFETLDISATAKLGRPPLRHPHFVADVHLGKLVRRLRLLGFDCLYDPAWDDAELAATSAAQRRVLLTRDRGLLKRAIVTHGVYLHSDQPMEQLREVLRRLDLYGLAQPFARCAACNGLLAAVPKERVRTRVPERTYRAVDRYYACSSCAKVYWKGTHWQRLVQIVQEALRQEDVSARKLPDDGHDDAGRP